MVDVIHVATNILIRCQPEWIAPRSCAAFRQRLGEYVARSFSSCHRLGRRDSRNNFATTDEFAPRLRFHG
jgi:hypothetical protein